MTPTSACQALHYVSRCPLTSPFIICEYIEYDGEGNAQPCNVLWGGSACPCNHPCQSSKSMAEAKSKMKIHQVGKLCAFNIGDILAQQAKLAKKADKGGVLGIGVARDGSVCVELKYLSACAAAVLQLNVNGHWKRDITKAAEISMQPGMILASVAVLPYIDRCLGIMHSSKALKAFQDSTVDLRQTIESNPEILDPQKAVTQATFLGHLEMISKGNEEVIAMLETTATRTNALERTATELQVC